MKISIIHPSRGRAEQAHKTMFNWLNKADRSIQYIFSLDTDDVHNYSQYAVHSGIIIPDSLECIYRDNDSAVEAINEAAKLATGDLFIVVSDDFDCDTHWDTLLLDSLKDKQDFCVKTKDGFQPVLMTLPIMDRTYYNRFGYIYNPIYKHWYADQEMTAVAHMLGKVESVDMLFTHNHYLAGKGDKDAINERNNLSAQSGKAIYQQRVKENFGIENPVLPYRQIQWR